MRLQIFLAAFLAIFFQSCTTFNGFNYGSSGSSIGGSFGYSATPAKPVKVELTQVTGNNLRFIERITFIRTLKDRLAKRGVVVIDTTPKLKLRVIIDRAVTQSTQHKTMRHGVVTYYLTEYYQTSTIYTITDRAGFTPVRGVINYNVLVKAKSIVGFDDAKRVALKKLFEAIATRVADDISAKGAILAAKYY